MKKAFSLIELSIVILIIGILVAGVTQASRLVSQMRLNNARAMTQSSPVASIKDLVAWYESTSEKSFDDAEEAEGLAVNNWYDINPQSSIKYNAAGAASTGLYVASAINGLPALRFNGNNDRGYANTSLVISDQMTTFAVVTVAIANPGFRRIVQSNVDGYFFIGIGSSGTQFAAFYGAAGWNHTGSFGADADLATNKGYVLSATQNVVGLNKGYVNGVDVGSPAFTPETKGISTGIRISNYGSSQSWYGDIGEIIIFDRALKTEERKEVEKYLGKKWGITVS